MAWQLNNNNKYGPHTVWGMLWLDEHLLFLCYLQVTRRHACLLAVSDNLLGVGGRGKVRKPFAQSLSPVWKRMPWRDRWLIQGLKVPGQKHNAVVKRTSSWSSSGCSNPSSAASQLVNLGTWPHLLMLPPLHLLTGMSSVMVPTLYSTWDGQVEPSMCKVLDTMLRSQSTHVIMHHSYYQGLAFELWC